MMGLSPEHGERPWLWEGRPIVTAHPVYNALIIQPQRLDEHDPTCTDIMFAFFFPFFKSLFINFCAEKKPALELFTKDIIDYNM